MSKEETSKKYSVGYGKPPKKTQFQKGVSGNPRGRPKKPTDFDEQLLREASLPVFINENGRRIRISKQEVAIRQLVHRAMKGDIYATRTFLSQFRQASARLAALAAEQKEKEKRLREPSSLTDEELEAIIRGWEDE